MFTSPMTIKTSAEGQASHAVHQRTKPSPTSARLPANHGQGFTARR